MDTNVVILFASGSDPRLMLRTFYSPFDLNKYPPRSIGML